MESYSYSKPGEAMGVAGAYLEQAQTDQSKRIVVTVKE